MPAIKRFIPVAMILFVAFVFIQSLFFKFTDAPETAHIFGTLNAWVVGLGLPGLFARNGLFSQYVIGTAELLAALLLLASLRPSLRWLRGYAAALGAAIMTGAIGFHLFTPLGVEVQGDGGLLFFMACLVWLCCVTLLIGALRQRRPAVAR